MISRIANDLLSCFALIIHLGQGFRASFLNQIHMVVVGICLVAVGFYLWHAIACSVDDPEVEELAARSFVENILKACLCLVVAHVRLVARVGIRTVLVAGNQSEVVCCRLRGVGFLEAGRIFLPLHLVRRMRLDFGLSLGFDFVLLRLLIGTVLATCMLCCGLHWRFPMPALHFAVRCTVPVRGMACASSGFRLVVRARIGGEAFHLH
mmetsp:Transcript_69855/g.166666  ORF Transcript_69855/g.166666 Transcript_69855/m.166666 type:complete len:208 (+) Transcript_69855:127-750(+)